MGDPESEEFGPAYPHFEEKFADGGDDGRHDGLTGIAGCLLTFLLIALIIGAIGLLLYFAIGDTGP